MIDKWRDTTFPIIISEIFLPYLRAHGNKSLIQQAWEIYTLHRLYGGLPYQYFRSALYVKDMDVEAVMPARLIQAARTRLNGDNSRIVDDKWAFAKRLSLEGLPQPRCLFRVDTGGAVQGFDGVLLDEPACRALVESVGGEIFVKELSASGGSGAQVVRPSLDGGWLERLVPEMGAVLAQERIKQHEKLAEINPASVNTVRLDTLRLEDGVHISGAVLKLGREGSVADNLAVSGGVAVEVDLETGRLGAIARRKPSFGTEPLWRHPDTGVRFEGREVPFWSEIRALVTRAAPVAAPLVSVGWDIAVTPDGPAIIEANANWEVSTTQLVQGLGRSRLGRLALEMRNS